MSPSNKFDVLAFGSHPDDVELGAGGTVAQMVADGYRVGIVDLTRGELGSRGTVELRNQEALDASAILGASRRVNLNLPDGDIRNTQENRLAVIRELRAARPNLILIPAPECRHPDHPDSARLIIDAVFQSGLSKIQTRGDHDEDQQTWRPHHILHYMQSVPFTPTVVMDVSKTWHLRNKAVQAYKSQVFNPDYVPGVDEPMTFISNPDFMKWYDARARNWGYPIGAEYGEPFLYHHGPFGSDDLVATFAKEKTFR
jgi:bacillithiol biosynthesis deacetylase BshB1